MASTQSLSDLLGNQYEFGIYQFEDAWKEVPGVYVFARWIAGRGCVPLYIGKADSFKSRLCASHHCWLDAIALGASHLLARIVPNEFDRTTLERRLIEAYNPPLNVQHRTAFRWT